MVEVTPMQNKYLKKLAVGSKTTQDLVMEFEGSAKSVSKMICILRDDKGLVESTLVPSTGSNNALLHSLTKSYEELVTDGLKVITKRYCGINCSKCGQWVSKDGFIDIYCDEYNGTALELGYSLCKSCMKGSKK